MKAYMVEGSDPDRGLDIVWAESASKAKAAAQFVDCCADDRYVDIRVKRVPGLDDMEDKVPAGGRPWNSDEIRVILVRDYNWACIEPWNNHEECDQCPARQWCHWMEDD